MNASGLLLMAKGNAIQKINPKNAFISMKRVWLYVILTLAAQAKSVSGQARFAPFLPGSPLSLDAHEVGTGDERYTLWEDDYGGYDRDLFRSKGIVITLHDLSSKSPGVELSVYFIATPAAQPNGRHFIYDRTEGFVKFDGQLEWKRGAAPRPLKANVQNYPLLERSYASGSDMDGWIVIAKNSSGSTFSAYASSQKLLEIAVGHGPESVDEMVAAYNKTNPPRNKSKVTPSTQTPVAEKSNPPNAAAPIGPNAAAPLPSTSPIKFVTALKPVSVLLPYGKATLQRGTKLPFVSRDAPMVIVQYGGVSVAIPISDTDLEQSGTDQRSATDLNTPSRSPDLAKEIKISKINAIQLYPDAAKPNTVFYKALQKRVEWIRKNQPDLFDDPTWPLHVTINVAQELSVSPDHLSVTPTETAVSLFPSGH
jgi:hypothetical protein